MATLEDLNKRLEQQEKRIRQLEKLVKVSKQEEAEEEYEPVQESKKKREPSFISQLSFIQVLTFLGVLGIIIGIVSFFFYAVANHWIGETLQVMMGILVGFVLFGLAYFLRKDHENWSNIVFGGSYFIEYLAVGIGVLEYKVIPPYFGIGLCALFLISSTVMSIILSSRIIGYFTLVGGYLVPFITGTYQYDLFILSYFSLLSFGLVLLSFKENWSDLRLSSFIVVAVFLVSQIGKFGRETDIVIPLTFLIILFVLYNAASIIGSLRKSNKQFSIVDSIIIVSFAVIFGIILYVMFDWSNNAFGLFLMLFSFVYLIELFFFKMSGIQIDMSAVYSLVSTGVVILNIGLYYILNEMNLDYIIIVFMIEYILFSIISANSKEEKGIYQIFSILSLALVLVLYYMIRFNDGLGHATFFMVVYFLFVISFIILFKTDINPEINGAGFIIGGFLLLYSFQKYLLFFLDKTPQLTQIILSITWLVYTLILFSQVHAKAAKNLVLVLMGVTILKIAFKDLLYLEGVYRILGFIIFGILLLIGGYFLHKVQNEKK